MEVIIPTKAPFFQNHFATPKALHVHSAIFAAMEFTLKKSLGQHFLKDEAVCKKIFNAIAAKAPTQLLEVGPGGGALTKYLLQLEGVDIKAVEFDREKVAYLIKNYPVLKGKLIEADFLTLAPPFDGSFMVFGNFPYNISTQIVFKVIEWKQQVPLMVGMFQKEVAERIVAASGSKVYGILSVLIQAYYKAEYLFDVTPESFTPPPKVMSGVIQLTALENPVAIRSDRSLLILVKAAFNQRRKMLRNATKSLFSADVLADELFNKRAEQLTVQQFAELTFKML